jgi:hypothetical protein
MVLNSYRRTIGFGQVYTTGEVSMIRLCTGNSLPSRHIPACRAHLRLEPLEDRQLLSADYHVAPILPVIDAGMQQHLRAILALGQVLGNSEAVFAKVGDSNTWLPSFLTPLGLSDYDPSNPLVAGDHTNLAATINFFRTKLVNLEGDNSFTHVSWASFGGWSSSDALNPLENRSPNHLPGETPLQTEFRLTRPAFALIMFGTNDCVRLPADQFRFNLEIIAATALEDGVIPILSTFPPIPAFPGIEPLVDQFNQVVADVASELNVPLWNGWREVQLLPGFGISADGVHLSTYPGGSGVFTDTALDYGFNVRNLLAVEVLDKLLRVVVANGTPDSPAGPAAPATAAPFVQELYGVLLSRSADPAELGAWEDYLQAGLPRLQVARAVWESPEHRGLQVDDYFHRFLHRDPDPVGRAALVGAFLAGANETAVETGILSSAEYQAAHVDDTAFVKGLYGDVLGRAPDAAGQAAWLAYLQAGASRAQVVQLFLSTREAYKNVVDGYYRAFLHRPADSAGELAWVTALQSGAASQEGVAEMILDSGEFLGQAGT